MQGTKHVFRIFHGSILKNVFICLSIHIELCRQYKIEGCLIFMDAFMLEGFILSTQSRRDFFRRINQKIVDQDQGVKHIGSNFEMF